MERIGRVDGVTNIAGPTVPKLEARTARRIGWVSGVTTTTGLTGSKWVRALRACFGKKVPKEADSRGKVELPLATRTP